MDLYGDLGNVAFAGSMTGLEIFNHKIESGLAQEKIAFGAPVFGFVGEEEKIYNVHQDLATLVLSTALIAANVLTVTINGVKIEKTFATSSATTIAALITAINASAELEALGNIKAVVGADALSILLKAQGLDLTVTAAVTLGDTQATVTITYGTWAKFLGIATFNQRGGKEIGPGESCYASGDMVNILSEGHVWVLAADTVSDKDPAHIIYAAGSTQKTFTDVAEGTYDAGAYFRSNYSNGLAILEVRGMK
jgi:hypothetical protein